MFSKFKEYALETRCIFPAILIILICAFLYFKFIDSPAGFIDDARLTTWTNAIVIYKQHWIFGYGVGHWQSIGIDAVKHGFKWMNKAHNDLLQGLFTMGILFPVLLVGYARSVYKRVPDFTDDRYLIPITALIMVLLNCSVHFLFQVSVTSIIAVTWVGILERELREV